MKNKFLIAALMALGVTAQAQDTTHNLDKDQLFAVSQANKAIVIEALTTGFDKQNIDAINIGMLIIFNTPPILPTAERA